MTGRLRAALDAVGRTGWSIYAGAALGRPWIAIFLAALLVTFAATGIPRFHLDASGDSLLLESDVELGYYRQIREKYGSDDFMIMTYTPSGDLFSSAVLDDLQRLRDDLAGIPGVGQVTTMLDVPLFESPPVEPETLLEGEANLRDPRTDIDLARNELRESPLYRNRLLSPDGQTTAIQLDMQSSEKLMQALADREQLRESFSRPGVDLKAMQELRTLNRRIDELRKSERRRTADLVAAVRGIADEYRDGGAIHLGGLPMISTDMLSYIRRDLRVFGIALVIVLTFVLGAIFREPRWVALPMLVSAATIVSMVGLLGYLGWPVTVVSSNFVSLLLILTLSLNVHLAVRYRELLASDGDAGNRDIVGATVRSKFLPSLMTAATTMVAFGSLTVAGIRPVIDFGWMMVIGIGLGFVLTFLLLPPCLVLRGRGQDPRPDPFTERVTGALCESVQQWPLTTSTLYVLLALASAWGLSRLDTDNRFIDYFDDETAIHEGMTFIDRNLGGTTPLDIIVDGPPEEKASDSVDPLPIPGEAGFAAESYWLQQSRIATAEGIHRFLDDLEHIGSVQSISTTMYVFRQLAGTDQPDSLEMSLIYRRMPDAIKQEIVAPYLSDDGDQLRFSARVHETNPDLDRDALLDRVRRYLTETAGIEPDRVNLTGIFVLYNNVLKNLLGSQLSTAGVVSLAVVLMFAVAFRSLKVAAVAFVPNLLGAAIVISVLGFAAIPLDIMTITIAAVAIGIGVDDTIHYVHRFRTEYLATGSYSDALGMSHSRVGRAMFYTTVTIVLGFCVLAVSDFVPTVYFGLLTGLAMAIALLADMTLLPILLVKVRAFCSR